MADAGETAHYEILVRQPSGWMLEGVATDRASATARAEALARSDGTEAVKVIFSRFDPGSGLFAETEVHTLWSAPAQGDQPAAGSPEPRQPGRTGVVRRRRRGAAAGTEAGGEPEPRLVLCQSPDDLCQPAGRALIARLLGPTLEAWQVTPSELLYRSELAQRLQAEGTVLQGAIQRAAILLAHQGAGSATVLVKHLFQLESDARRRLAALPERALPPVARLCRALAGLTTWADKIEHLGTALAAGGDTDAPVAAPPAAVDQLWAEILGTNGGLGTVLRCLRPQEATTGGQRHPPVVVVADLLHLLDGSSDPVLAAPPATGQENPPGLGDLLARLRQGQLPCSRAALEARIAHALASPRLFTGPAESADLGREAAALRAIAERTGALAPEPATAPAILRALERRSEALLRPERLGQLLDAASAPALELMHQLFALSRSVVGEFNLRLVGKNLLAQCRRVEQQPAPSGDLLAQLQQLGAWRGELVNQGRFPPELRERLTAALDRVSLALAERGQLFVALARRHPEPVPQALALAELVASGGLHAAATQQQAHQRLLRCLEHAGGREAFARQLAGQPATVGQLEVLHRFLGRTGPGSGGLTASSPHRR